jgi:hypothetical protein
VKKSNNIFPNIQPIIHPKPNLSTKMSERMQQQLSLPMELVWEVVVCIPAEHLIRLEHSGPTRSAALNFLIEKFSRPLVGKGEINS